MRAMVLERPGAPLRELEVPDPVPGPGQVLVEVRACAVCRTDLHVVDGELLHPKLPLIPGHQIAGIVRSVVPGGDTPTGGPVPRSMTGGHRAPVLQPGDRVGIPWLGWTCGTCRFCRAGRENLCESARFTGYDIDGGYAELAVADVRYCFPIPEGYPDLQAAPLLCAGLIGYRAYRMAAEAVRIGFYGFGAAASILIQVARFQGRRVFAFTKPGDARSQAFARRLGAVWAGDTAQDPPEPLDAAILFAPAGDLVPIALRHIEPGGVVVCAGIHMSDIPSFPYAWLWKERTIRSVANLTRRDGAEFLDLAPRVPVKTEVEAFPLSRANEALRALREGRIDGSAVVVPSMRE
jgi:propanol-preferring alcohol dehydrogenase